MDEPTKSVGKILALVVTIATGAGGAVLTAQSEARDVAETVAAPIRVDVSALKEMLAAIRDEMRALREDMHAHHRHFSEHNDH